MLHSKALLGDKRAAAAPVSQLFWLEFSGTEICQLGGSNKSGTLIGVIDMLVN